MSICDLYPGQKGIVNEIHGDSKLVKRLLALGCIENTEVSVERIAPLGDPIMINLRGFNLALRRKDAKHIHIRRA